MIERAIVLCYKSTNRQKEWAAKPIISFNLLRKPGLYIVFMCGEKHFVEIDF